MQTGICQAHPRLSSGSPLLFVGCSFQIGHTKDGTLTFASARSDWSLGALHRSTQSRSPRIVPFCPFFFGGRVPLQPTSARGPSNQKFQDQCSMLPNLVQGGGFNGTTQFGPNSTISPFLLSDVRAGIKPVALRSQWQGSGAAQRNCLEVQHLGGGVLKVVDVLLVSLNRHQIVFFFFFFFFLFFFFFYFFFFFLLFVVLLLFFIIILLLLFVWECGYTPPPF